MYMHGSEDRRKIQEIKARREREPSKHEALHIHSPPRPRGRSLEGFTGGRTDEV
jgi:hypothetical protein